MDSVLRQISNYRLWSLANHVTYPIIANTHVPKGMAHVHLHFKSIYRGTDFIYFKNWWNHIFALKNGRDKPALLLFMKLSKINSWLLLGTQGIWPPNTQRVAYEKDDEFFALNCDQCRWTLFNCSLQYTAKWKVISSSATAWRRLMWLHWRHSMNWYVYMSKNEEGLEMFGDWPAWPWMRFKSYFFQFTFMRTAKFFQALNLEVIRFHLHMGSNNSREELMYWTQR